jgi:arylsulfatase A-like enzyme
MKAYATPTCPWLLSVPRQGARLLTGYNIHQIGTGIISELATGYPGYNSQIDYTTPSIAKILTDNGYATAAFGKWHNTPWKKPRLPVLSRAGPRASGDLSTSGVFWAARLTSSIRCCTKTPRPLTPRRPMQMDQNFIYPTAWPTRPLSGWIDGKDLRDAPFFMYYTPGAVHAPIQVPEEWRDKYKGQFDDGWHVYREQQLERQKKLGLVPEDAKLVDWPEVLPTWDSFSEEGKRYLSRQMEVNAAFLEHVDHHVGRVIDHIEEMGELDNTLVIYLSADNGATAEGTPTGTFSELLMQNGFPPLTMEQQLEKLEEFGGLDAWGGLIWPTTFQWRGPTHPPHRSSGPSRWRRISAEPCRPRPYDTRKPLKQGRMAQAISECDRSRSNHS